MAGRGEGDTRDWLFSGGRPVSDVRPGFVSNSLNFFHCFRVDCWMLLFKMT